MKCAENFPEFILHFSAFPLFKRCNLKMWFQLSLCLCLWLGLGLCVVWGQPNRALTSFKGIATPLFPFVFHHSDSDAHLSMRNNIYHYGYNRIYLRTCSSFIVSKPFGLPLFFACWLACLLPSVFCHNYFLAQLKKFIAKIKSVINGTLLNYISHSLNERECVRDSGLVGECVANKMNACSPFGLRSRM